MYLPAGLLMIFIILYGTLPRAFTTLTYSCYGDLFEDNDQIPIARSTVMFVGNLIGAALTALFGYIIQFSGYNTLWYVCIALGIAAAVCWVFAKKIK
jgi:predicted MFS family arabinose efflux permease